MSSEPTQGADLLSPAEAQGAGDSQTQQESSDSSQQPTQKATHAAPASVKRERESTPFATPPEDCKKQSPSSANFTGPLSLRSSPGGSPGGPFAYKRRSSLPMRMGEPSCGAPWFPAAELRGHSSGRQPASPPIACSGASAPSWVFGREARGDARGQKGLLGLIERTLASLQQRAEVIASACRGEALAVLSSVKWLFVLGMGACAVLGCLLVCLCFAVSLSYCLIAAYSTPPPLHVFPVHFNYFPKVAASLAAQEKSLSWALQRKPQELQAASSASNDPETLNAADGEAAQEGPPLVKHPLLGGPAPQMQQQWGPPSIEREGSWGGFMRGSSGFSLSSLEDPLAIATVPFSNRSWELLPLDTEMFTGPVSYLSSHWPQQQQQQQQQQQLELGPSQEELKLPSFNVDMLLSLSLPKQRSSGEAAAPAVMLSLSLHSRDGTVVARSSRPLLPVPTAWGPLGPLFWGQQMEQTIYLMEGFPLQKVPDLRFARVYMYPPLSLFGASLLLQPKPEGLRLFVIQHPLTAYLICTLLLLLAATAALCSCLYCCITLAAAPDDESCRLSEGPTNTGAPSLSESPQLQPWGTLHSSPSSTTPPQTSPPQETHNKYSVPTPQQQQQEQGETKGFFTGAPNLRLRVAARRAAGQDLL